MNHLPQGPSPALFFDTVSAYHQSAALKGAVELGLFTAIAAGANSPDEIAAQCQAAPRGVRILCDYLAILGFLTKEGEGYALTPDSALFLDRRSPAYLGGTLDFLLNPRLTRNYQDIAAVVRRGGSITEHEGAIAPESPIWVDFARAMVPMMVPVAEQMAGLINAAPAGELQVLDIAAGHGMYGITVAQRFPQARVVGLDWAKVLEVAIENAARLGVADRYSTIAGSAFDADFGGPYDVVLIPNFLHHFDIPTNETLLRKVAAALRPGGQVVVVEFVPNDDRISPPAAASFSFTMLGSTPSGDAYTFREIDAMLRAAGFGAGTEHSLHGPQTVVTAMK